MVPWASLAPPGTPKKRKSDGKKRESEKIQKNEITRFYYVKKDPATGSVVQKEHHWLARRGDNLGCIICEQLRQFRPIGRGGRNFHYTHFTKGSDFTRFSEPRFRFRFSEP